MKRIGRRAPTGLLRLPLAMTIPFRHCGARSAETIELFKRGDAF